MYLKLVNIRLQFFYKGTDMITITNRVVDLDGQGKQALAVPLEELAHRKDRQKELALIKHIDVKASKLQPGYHRDVKGIDWGVILGCITGRFGILLRIRFVALQKFRILYQRNNSLD